MIGKNGINEKSEKSIIIFDSSIQLEKIRSMQETENSQIISMDYQSFRLLKDNNIPCISSDEFLTNDEMQNIQSLCYELSEWYLFEPLNKILEYKNVNLGSVIQAEFINIIINYLRKFFIIHKITLEYPEFNFICSRDFSMIISEFTKKIHVLDTKKNTNMLPLDSINTNLELGFKNRKIKLKIGQNILN